LVFVSDRLEQASHFLYSNITRFGGFSISGAPMSNSTSLASYATSATLAVKGVMESAANAWSGIPIESKIGILLGVGTFIVNWYYERRRTRAAERASAAGRLLVERED
jgi:hypothetical protein